MKRYILGVFVVVLAITSAASVLAQSPDDDFGEALGANLVLGYATSYSYLLTIGDAYLSGYPKDKALERSTGCLEMIEGSKDTYYAMVVSYSKHNMLTNKSLEEALGFINAYEALIVAGNELKKFIESDGKDAKALTTYSELMQKVYMGMEEEYKKK